MRFREYGIYKTYQLGYFKEMELIFSYELKSLFLLGKVYGNNNKISYTQKNLFL